MGRFWPRKFLRSLLIGMKREMFCCPLKSDTWYYQIGSLNRMFWFLPWNVNNSREEDRWRLTLISCQFQLPAIASTSFRGTGDATQEDIPLLCWLPRLNMNPFIKSGSNWSDPDFPVWSGQTLNPCMMAAYIYVTAMRHENRKESGIGSWKGMKEKPWVQCHISGTTVVNFVPLCVCWPFQLSLKGSH